MRKNVFCLVMVIMTITAIKVGAQPVPAAVTETIETPAKITPSRKFSFLKLDSTDLRDMRIDSLRKEILDVLDSIFERNNFRLVNKIKYYQTQGGEFSVRELYKGNFEFSGNCGCDIYRFDLRNVYWDRLGKKFRLKFGTVFYGDKDVDVSIVEVRFSEFLKRLRTGTKQ